MKRTSKRICLALVFVLITMLLTACATPERTYKSAQSLLAQEKYSEAAQKLDSISSYEDAATLAMYCKACALCESGDYEAGLTAFESLRNYKDTAYRITYYSARAYEISSGTDNWEYMLEAKALYNTIPVFLDSAERIIQLDAGIEAAKLAQYNTAVKDGDGGNYSLAQSAFARLGDYKDSMNRYAYYGIRAEEDALAESIDQDALVSAANLYTQMGGFLDCANRAVSLTAKADCIVADKYANVQALTDKGKCVEAEFILAVFGTYGSEQVTACYYTLAEKYLAQNEWAAASASFRKAEMYSDAASRINEPYYKQAEALLAEGKWDEASAAFVTAGDYRDATARINEPYYKQAEALLAANDEAGAIAAFRKAGTYGDASQRLKPISYALGERLLAEGKWEAASAAFTTAAGYKDALSVAYSIKYQYLHTASISAGWYHTVGLKSDGTVVAVGRNNHGQCNVSGWKDIIAVSAGGKHTVGLKSDGSVVAVGDALACGVSDWKNIIAISAGGQYTVGLKSDGTVVSAGDNSRGQCEVSDWKDIIAVTAGDVHTVGLKSDGTVVSAGYKNYRNVSNWKDIIAISAGDRHTVGLKSDGTIVSVGYNDEGQCNVSRWEDIIAISAGGKHTVILNSNSTVDTAGEYFYGQGNVDDWTDIIAISAGDKHTVGLKSDGTVLSTGGYSDYNLDDVSNWKLWD